jgi:integrase
LRKQIHMINRKGVYYFRRRIPTDLVAHYSKQEIIFSLKTRDPAEADRLQRLESVKLDAEFERLRNKPQPISVKASVAKSSITPEEEQQLIALALYSRISADEEIRNEGVDDLIFDRLSESTQEFKEAERAAIARGMLTDHTKSIVSDWLIGHGYELPEESPEFRQFALKFMKSQTTATKALELRQSGEHIETPSQPKITPQSASNDESTDTFEALRDYWFMQTNKSTSALRIATTAIKKFRELVGNLRPSEVTKHHTIQLKDKLLEKGAAPATINKDMGILRAIFSTAEANSKLPSNPFKGWKDLPVPEREEEAPYSIEELKLIFNSPVFKDGYRPTKGKDEAAFWLPLIGLYTGCRLNEGAQIFTEDVGELDGIPYFLIKPDSATGRSVKDGKKRRVPIHPDLVRMGLLEYVAKMRQEGHVQLFLELTITRSQGKLGDKWGSWWSSYIREDLGITRIPQPFHAFRHTFVEHGRISKMESELRRIIEGHTPNTVEFKIYGSSQYPLEPLYEEILKLRYRGLDLSHLYTK